MTADGECAVSAKRVESGIRLSLKPTNPFASLLFRVLEEAEERRFGLPLYMSVKSADGRADV
jgi:hypothetical protein